MSGKFMKVKRICISTLTLLVIASQLTGCASSTQKEMLNMYNNNQSITIEIAEPISQEQGEQREYEWVELASLDTYSDFRMIVDDIMGITAHGTNGKNGVVYVDLEGNHTNNSTLRFAFANQKFLDSVWNNSDSMKSIIEATNSNYADIETDSMARAAFLNAYFNIFADAEPNYFNGYQTLTRAEFLGGVFRATSPVYEITLGNEFGAAVDPAGTSDDTVYAEKMEDYSYLTTEYRNLNEDTFGGTITRAEAIYTLVKMFYADEYDATTGNEKVNYTDAKNGGNIAKECGFITVDKKSGTTTYKDLWKTYELSYALQTDNGLPTDLYRALVVAEKHGLIKGTDSRWDEAIVKREVIDMLVAAFEDLGTVNNVDRGAASDEAAIAIDYKDIDPDIHATYSAETGEITVDDIITTTMMEKAPFFTEKKFDAKETAHVLSKYLKGYFTDRYDGEGWLQFAITGDTTYLNFEISETDFSIQLGQEVDVYINSEEGQDAMKNDPAYELYLKSLELLENVEEETYKDIADELGITVEEAKELATGGDTNGGGGSAPVAKPSTKQPNATEDTFVTPEVPSGGNNGTSNSVPWQGDGTFVFDEDPGDGGPLTGNVSLNP